MNLKNSFTSAPRIWVWVTAAAALAVSGLTLPGETTRTLTMAGSELLGPAVEQAWQDYGAEIDVEVKTAFRGSRPARDRLEAGVVDMVVLVDDPSESGVPEGWVALPLAHVAALVVVPRDLTLEQLSFRDLNRIYNANSAVATTRWGDFGATGKWEYTPISMHVMTAASGLAHEIFGHEVLQGEAMKGSVKRHDEWETALSAATEDDGGIGIVSWLPVGHPKLKSLLISPEGDQVAFGPSAENMSAGDYPLAITLRLVVPRTRVAEMLPWLQFWYRDEITAALREDRLMPLPPSDRNQQVFDLEVIE